MLYFPQGFLSCALSLDLCRIAAIIGAELHIRPRCRKSLAAVLTNNLTASFLRRFLSVELCTAILTAI